MLDEHAVRGKQNAAAGAQNPAAFLHVKMRISDMFQNLGGKDKIVIIAGLAGHAIRAEHAVHFGSRLKIGGDITGRLRKQGSVGRAAGAIIENHASHLWRDPADECSQIREMKVILIKRAWTLASPEVTLVREDL
jgi:hypothetical protein